MWICNIVCVCVFCCTTDISSKTPKAGQYLAWNTESTNTMNWYLSMTLLFCFFFVYLCDCFNLYSISFHLEKIYRHRADSMSFTVAFCWECGSAAVTAEHLVPPASPEWIRVSLSDLGHCSTTTQLPSLSKTSIFSNATSRQKIKVSALTSCCLYY